MSGKEEKVRQHEHLEKVIRWAKKLRGYPSDFERRYAGRVLFRPSSTGIAMIGLTPENPQRGGAVPVDASENGHVLEELYLRHCVGVPQGRQTPEKALQSFLISRALAANRQLEPINEASRRTHSPVDLTFMVDEISVPVGESHIVCDLLAVRWVEKGVVPVVIELKSNRRMKRLVEQVETYAALVDRHRDQYKRLLGAFCSYPIDLVGPCEKWIVWPMAGKERDPRENELAARGIRVVGYEQDGDGFRFRVGRALGDALPRKLHVYIGGYMGHSYSLDLHRDALTYSVQSHGYTPESTEEVFPTDDQWRAFAVALDRLRVWEWETGYVTENICDGTNWSFSINLRSRKMASGGSNGFPDNFDEFLEAVRALIGGRDFS
jgi:hypothetical protein